MAANVVRYIVLMHYALGDPPSPSHPPHTHLSSKTIKDLEALGYAHVIPMAKDAETCTVVASHIPEVFESKLTF